MTTEKEKFKDGFFSLSRSLFNSEIWVRKPAEWLKIWIYVIGKVDHKTGEGFFNFAQERKAIGRGITEDQVKKCIVWLKTQDLIRTKKSTRGIVIKVALYADFQSSSNYGSTTEALQKHQDKQYTYNNRAVKFDDVTEGIALDLGLEPTEALSKFVNTIDNLNYSFKNFTLYFIAKCEENKGKKGYSKTIATWLNWARREIESGHMSRKSAN